MVSTLEALYSTQMTDTLKAIGCLSVIISDSQFQRYCKSHCMEVETALCDLAAAVEKEAVVVA
jgi:Tfp pilus assembly protein PilE